MTFSNVVAPGNVRSSSQRSSRNGVTIDHFILHHSAAFDVNQVLGEMVNATKQVSANYVVANDGTAYGVVDEEDRAWTSGSSTDGGRGAAWDRRSITFEILDQTGAPDWTVSAAAQETVARIVADCSRRYGIAPQRVGGDTGWTVYGHRELYTIFGASYSTACPGGLPLDNIAARSAAILTPTKKAATKMRLLPLDNTSTYFLEVDGVGLYTVPDQGTADVLFRYLNATASVTRADIDFAAAFVAGPPTYKVFGHPAATVAVDANALAAALAPLIGHTDTTALAAAVAAALAPQLAPIAAGVTALTGTLAKGYNFNIKPVA